MFILFLACTASNAPTPAPAEATPPAPAPWVDSGLFRPDQTGEPVLDNPAPAHLLSVEQRGVWTLPDVPHHPLLGLLNVRERLDGYTPHTADTGDRLDCDVTWILTGSDTNSLFTCPGCELSWELSFHSDSHSVSDTSACHDPELPHEGETWQMAFHPVDQKVYFNYYGTGVWVPWWDARMHANQLRLTWSKTLAVTVEDTP